MPSTSFFSLAAILLRSSCANDLVFIWWIYSVLFCDLQTFCVLVFSDCFDKVILFEKSVFCVNFGCHSIGYINMSTAGAGNRS